LEFPNFKQTLFSASSVIFFILIDPNFILEKSAFGGNDEFNSTKYCFSFKWGLEGTGDDQFLRPHDVNFDSKGKAYKNK